MLATPAVLTSDRGVRPVGQVRPRQPLAADLYQRARARGHDHSHAVRVLARAWVDIIWPCWTTNTPTTPPNTAPVNASLPRSTGRGLAQGNSSADRVNGSRQWSSAGSAGRTRSRTARRMAGERWYQSARAGVASAVASSGPVMSTAFCSSLAWWSCHVIWPRWSPPGRGIPDIRV